MTPQQLEAIETLRQLGYVVEYDRRENNGIIRVSMPRRWRKGVFDVLIRPDGSYRGGKYVRWDAIPWKVT